MFPGVNTKFERAQFFLVQLSSIQIGTQPWRAYLDAFFFELISAKDFFLQALNEKYTLGLKKDSATKLDLLKRCLECKGHLDALRIVKTLEKELHSENSWLWSLNNYRNSATHRELLRMNYEVGTSDHTQIFLAKDPEDISKGNTGIEVIPYCQKSLTELQDFLNKLYDEIQVNTP
jgi:hypothetical protein